MPDMASPLYDPASVEPAYQLRYSWTAWPASHFEHCPVELIAEVKSLWENDGLHVLEHRWTTDAVQILFSAQPMVSPQFIATRAKGRLDHAARQAGVRLDFSRKLAVRSVGDNTREDIEDYIARQVTKERFVDPRFEAMMEEFTIHDPTVDLSQPTESARGRYWYNLHMVLVVEGRARISDLSVLARLRDGALKIAAKKGHRVSRISVMPDHLHAALRPLPDEAPIDVVFAYQNNLAYLLNLGRIWRESFYVGTFGEYTTHAVHRAASR